MNKDNLVEHTLENKIEKFLTEYYRKRNVIENSFGYLYHGTVGVRVKNLTKKYVDKLKDK